MIRNIKKRGLFFLGVFVAGLLGMVGNYIRTNYSKDDSLFISSAHADYAAWDVGNGWAGDGGGGCSGDASGY